MTLMRALLFVLCALCLALRVAQAQPELHADVSVAPLVAPTPAPIEGSPSITVHVNATSFKNRDWIEVTYSGVPEPGPDDFVAAIFEGQDLATSVPTRFKVATRSPDYLSTGAGNLTFQLLNQRQNVSFMLFANISKYMNFSAAEIIGSSPIITLENPNEPVQGHLALTSGGPSYMLVEWTTRDALTPTVQYGTTSGHYTHSATGNTTTYTREDMCGAPANTTGWIDPGTLNNVLLSGLTTSTQYYYVYGDPEYGFSEEFRFTTGPEVGPNSSILVLANADPGHALRDDAYEWEYTTNTRLITPPGSSADIYSAIVNQFSGNGLQQGASLGIAAGMLADAAGRTLAFFDGDLSYARGFATQWDVHFDQFADLAQQMPVMVVEGNHERDWPGTGDRFQGTATDSGGECGVPTHLRYMMPTPNPVEEGKYWYSFDHGPVHYIQYSTELDYSAGSPQEQWIQNDLKSVNRSITPWIIANLHRPIYTTSISGVSQSSDMQGGADQRAAFEDLFYQYSVDLTFCGHVHWYERTCNVYQKTCIPNNADGSANAPVHVTMGNGGQWLSIFFNPDMPAYLEALAIEHGYMRYSVNQTMLSAEMVSSVTGAVMDEFTLTKPVGWTANATARAAQLSLFEPNTTPGSNWIDTYGIDGGITSNISTLLLDILEANPSMYMGLQNATLVQNVNAVDTLENTLQVLNPALELLYLPEVQNSPNLTASAKTIIQEYFLPWLSIVNVTSPVIMGQQGLQSASTA